MWPGPVNVSVLLPVTVMAPLTMIMPEPEVWKVTDWLKLRPLATVMVLVVLESPMASRLAPDR